MAEENNNNNNNYGDDNGDGDGDGPSTAVVCNCKCGGCHRKDEGCFPPPPGYKFKFKPSDQELIVDYLKKKLMNQPLPYDEIMRKIMVEVDLYNHHHPQDLTAEYTLGSGQKKWYFFTPTDRKYPNTDIPNRATGFGYWKSTGVDQVVKKNGVIVGYKRGLVFHEGQPPKGLKTNWIMHEYRVTTRNTNYLSMRLDDWVLCKISYKKNASTKPKTKQEDEIAIMITGEMIGRRIM